jgi:hypothetical protein
MYDATRKRGTGKHASASTAMNLVHNFRRENSQAKPETMQNWCRYGEMLEILARAMILSRGQASLRSLIEDWSMETVVKAAGKSAASRLLPAGKCRW